MSLEGVLRIGSRGSKLAVVQAEWVGSELNKHHPRLKIVFLRITTSGDRNLGASLQSLGGKGVFVKEIEEALLENKIDLAVHSLKDVPQLIPSGLCLGPFPKREDPREAVISRSGQPLRKLAPGSVVATSSPRRVEQLKRMFKNGFLKIEPIRGNVETRIRKVREGACEAVVMALAGLRRLGLESEVTQILELKEMMPASGQGCLGLELRVNDARTRELIEPIKDEAGDLTARAERSFLQALGGNCLVPVASTAEIDKTQIRMEAMLFDPGGDRVVAARETGSTDEAELVGAKLAGRILYEGGSEILIKLDEPKPSS